MKTFKIELIEIGRNNHSETIVRNFMTKELACQFAIDEAGKHLMSSDISMSVKDNDETNFIVFAGFRTVGEVKITEENDK